MTYAQEPTTETSPEGRAQEFKPADLPEQTTSAEAMLVAAYLVMWALIFLFVFGSARRQKSLEERMARLEKGLSRDAPKSD